MTTGSKKKKHGDEGRLMRCFHTFSRNCNEAQPLLDTPSDFHYADGSTSDHTDIYNFVTLRDKA